VPGTGYVLQTECWPARRDEGAVRISGESDQANAEVISAWIITAMAAEVVHLDLSHVSFVGAVGLRVVFSARDALPPGTTTPTVTWSPPGLRVAQLTGICDADQLVSPPGDPAGLRWPERR
jgi:anti-anti-sigma factor